LRGSALGQKTFLPWIDWRHKLIRKFNLSIGALLLACFFISCVSRELIGYAINKFKQTEVGRSFLKDHSEKDLVKVLAFIQDPVRNFPDVQSVADVCSYMHAYAQYISETNDDAIGYLTFFSTHFRIATDENVPILDYLMLNCHNAFLMDAIADYYTKLFAVSPEIFVKDLKRRANWKRIVDEAGAGDWRAFKEGLAKLGNAGFERELKNYALSVYK
jgi:hypothetical protein